MEIQKRKSWMRNLLSPYLAFSKRIQAFTACVVYWVFYSLAPPPLNECVKQKSPRVSSRVTKPLLEVTVSSHSDKRLSDSHFCLIKVDLPGSA